MATTISLGNFMKAILFWALLRRHGQFFSSIFLQLEKKSTVDAQGKI
jgi:hypothetical protein